MAQVVWTREALSDVAAIRSYIGQFNPEAAARLAERLIEAGDSLAEFPAKGRSVGHGFRQWSLIRPYLIRYLVDGQHVYIIDIVHGAQNA